MSISNPAFFLFDVMQRFISILSQYQFLGITLFNWILGFVAFSIIASVFWKGARG